MNRWLINAYPTSLCLILTLFACGSSTRSEVFIPHATQGESRDLETQTDADEDLQANVDDEDATPPEPTSDPEAVSKAEVGALLIEYCQACHAIGDKRFILSEDPTEVFEYIMQTRNPDAPEYWAESIAKSLDWPDGALPPPGEYREGTKEWMPVGKKRFDLHRALDAEGESVRQRFFELVEEFSLGLRLVDEE